VGASHLHRIERSVCTPFLERVVACLQHCAGVHEIRVFGSYASDTLSAASDVDVAVIVSAPAFADRQRLRGRVSKAHGPGDPPYDLLFIPLEDFQARKDFGGICYDVFHGGETLWRSENGSV
jgi:predicted nucleotidyltransferase